MPVELTESETKIVLGETCLPEWFIDAVGLKYIFLAVADLDAHGCFDLDLLEHGQCIIYPGAIYEREKQEV